MKNNTLTKKIYSGWNISPMVYVGIVVALVILLLLAAGRVLPVYGQEEITIKEVQRYELGDSQYKVVLKYCKQNVLAEPIGMIISSDIGKAAIAVDTKAKLGQCELYVANVNSSQPSFIKATLFEKDGVPQLVDQFEQRLANFEAKKINAIQDLRIEKSSPDPDINKIERLEKNIMRFEQTIKNTKNSLGLLSSYL